VWNLSAGEIKDCSSARFGWRQIKLAGKKMLLNGQEINLVADICHPFGPFMFTRTHIESWYRLIKSVGGNAVRLHAQIHPRLFLDIADEMGLMVLDETAIFGSCLTLNFEEPQAWERYAEHFDGLILRDRNHPSVFGWSFSNELFAIFLYDEAAKQDEDGMYARIFELGNRARLLDPTREFVTCDGDEDLRGTLPVWSKHYGHGIHHLPAHIEKPMVVGESGGTYYARPQQMAEFNGDKAYADYAGRANALGIDLYANIRHFDKDLVYFSPSELMWFGLRQLPYGYSDTSRLPDLTDGIFFPLPPEGQPGIFIERLPPFTGVLNPGWDPALPEFIPLDMYHAMKDALTFDPAHDEKWQKSQAETPEAPPEAHHPKVTLHFISGEADLQRINPLLPFPVSLTNRPATMLKVTTQHPWVAALTAKDLYFAESDEKHIMHHGMTGEFISRAAVLLSAGDTDWSLFNNRPENVKCGSVALYEMLEKEPGAALAILPHGDEMIAVTTIRKLNTPEGVALLQKLYANMGLDALDTISHTAKAKQAAEHDLLLHGPVEG
jgi:beta-galactosidase